MSSVTAHNTSGTGVILVRTTVGTISSYVNGFKPWVSTDDWVVDTSGATEGTYSAADKRRYLTGAGPNEAAAVTNNVTVAYSATTDNGASGAVQWGLPRTTVAATATKIISVFSPASL